MPAFLLSCSPRMWMRLRLRGESARECAERLACEKALAVWQTRPQDLVLGADTVVVVDGEMLGKPVNGEDAARMLRLLSGRVHQVITGVCLTGGRGRRPVASGQWSEKPRTASRVDSGYYECDLGPGDSRLRGYRRADGQGGGVRDPGNGFAMDSSHRR